MVDNIVIGMENTETVIRGSQCFHNLVIGGISGFGNALCRGTAEPKIFLVIIIELDTVVGAGIGDGATAVGASYGCALGCIFTFEIREIAERGDFLQVLPSNHWMISISWQLFARSMGVDSFSLCQFPRT